MSPTRAKLRHRRHARTLVYSLLASACSRSARRVGTAVIARTTYSRRTRTVVRDVDRYTSASPRTQPDPTACMLSAPVRCASSRRAASSLQLRVSRRELAHARPQLARKLTRKQHHDHDTSVPRADRAEPRATPARECATQKTRTLYAALGPLAPSPTPHAAPRLSHRAATTRLVQYIRSTRTRLRKCSSPGPAACTTAGAAALTPPPPPRRRPPQPPPAT